jgi:hypothetical protein
LANRTFANIDKGHLSNFFQADSSAVTPIAANAICHDPSDDWVTIGGLNGQLFSGRNPELRSSGGLVYGDEVGPGIFINDLEADGNGVRVAVVLEDDGVYRSAALGDGLWVKQTIPGAPALNFTHVGHDRNANGSGGLWMIGADTGEVYSSPDGITWTLQAAGLSATIVDIKHSRDPSAPMWLACTQTSIARSSDGLNWGSPVDLTTQITSPMNRVEYSPQLVAGRGTWLSFAGFILRSEDNGLTWSEADLLPDTVGPGKNIASDRAMGWICATNQNENFYSSKDNGLSWQKEYRGIVTLSQSVLMVFGSGRFFVVRLNGQVDYSLKIR